MKSRLYHLTAANVLGLSITLFLFFNKVSKNQGYMDSLLILMVLILTVLCVFLVLEYAKYKDAALILENEIMKIKVARIEHETSRNNAYIPTTYYLDASISCFGVLLDTKIIKFNREKISLNSIEIRRDAISFTYSSQGVSEKLTILHGALDKKQIQCIVDRFRYETGVIPRVLDFK